MNSKIYIGLIVSIIVLILVYLNVEHKVQGWDKNVDRNVSHYLSHISTQIVPTRFCNEPLKTLIIVTSAPSNENERQTIRETWGNTEDIKKYNSTVMFFTGKSSDPEIQKAILTECEKYDDIIQEDFVESYFNLTLKSTLIMRLVSNRCIGRAQYLLKIDDDMFLNVPNLFEMIVEKNKSENLLIGLMECNARPIKDPFSKWYTPNYLFNETVFPNFVAGISYLMSVDTSLKLYKAALTTPLFHLEDVYLTGLCARNAGIHPEHSNQFIRSAPDDEPCQFKNYIAIHDMTPSRMRNTFYSLSDSSLMGECSNYEEMFNVRQWMWNTLFTPYSRSKRKRLCN
ncbi:beta-1,3-galactosyltransferase 1 [Diabrotica virgifera virgifera]|uniref:Hexosyltransferase n=1 Tax=Diabrotica virgifera virgifera TaxID=50390 RepID=A0ABM5IW63_DIAVI|nr:beta-1,3-galactosyltransferase 1 [Diabrotica virgifera virgifera]